MHNPSAGTRSKYHSFNWPQQPQKQINQTDERKTCGVGTRVGVSGFLFQQPLPPPGSRWMETSIWSEQINLQMIEASCDRKKKTARNTVSISVSQPSGAIKRPNRPILTNYFLLPMSLGDKSWQKLCRSHSNKICLDARRLVATCLQTVRLDFPLAIYCWPSANCECGLVRADEWNKVWLKAGALVFFSCRVSTNQYNSKLKTDLPVFLKAQNVL